MHLLIVLKIRLYRSRLHKDLPIFYNLFFLFPFLNQFISPFNGFIINKITVGFLFLSKPVIYLNALFISILENKQIYIYSGMVSSIMVVQSHTDANFFFLGGSQTQALQPITHLLYIIDKVYIHCTLLFNVQLHIVLKSRLHTKIC